MRISELLKDINLPAGADVEVRKLVLDSRQVTAGDVFLAVRGAASDGRQFMEAAIRQGAAAVIKDADSVTDAISFQNDIPIIPVQHLKSQIGFMAARFYGDPAKALRMIGVTGTNGKTSCTHFMAQILGAPCGVIGTLGSGLYGALGEVGLTTPDAVTLQKLLREFVDSGAGVVAMEVSSHSIDQGRVNGIEFEMGVFTNLTQDHLDYHGTMAAYADVKRRFIVGASTQHVIVNADDAIGKSWINELAGHKSVFAYSTGMPLSERDALKVPLIYTDNVELSPQGVQADVFTPWGNAHLSTPLIGRFNLSNVLAVLTAMCFYGLPFAEVLRRLSRLNPVPGRMQALTAVGKPLVVVDYSHTPDALYKALEALRSHTAGQLICVFGCGGDRDATKRPIMAQIAEKLADRVIVTNDNPRHELPEVIASQIMQGFSRPEQVSVLLDRSKAIQNSIQCGTAGDCILVAGKGAERYQQVGDDKLHFDDVEEVKKYLA